MQGGLWVINRRTPKQQVEEVECPNLTSGHGWMDERWKETHNEGKNAKKNKTIFSPIQVFGLSVCTCCCCAPTQFLAQFQQVYDGAAISIHEVQQKVSQPAACLLSHDAVIYVFSSNGPSSFVLHACRVKKWTSAPRISKRRV